MRTGILAVVALTMGGVALADEPPQPVPQQVIEDLTELRQEIGATSSTPAEFAQAVQSIVEGRGQQADSLDLRPAATAWAADGAQRPTHNPWDVPPSVHRPTYTAPAVNTGWNNMPQFQAGPAIAANPYASGPPPHHAKPGPKSPKALLQDTAFDLERMAHELDKAELYGEADALRGAASRLRMTARQQKKPDGRPQPPQADRPGPAPVEHPHAAERARRAIQQANDHAKRLERQIGEMEARLREQADEFRRRVREAEDRARRAADDAHRGPREAPEGSQRPRERRRERPDRLDRDRPDLPPPGVHGGPTDPPPPPELAPGQ